MAMTIETLVSGLDGSYMRGRAAGLREAAKHLEYSAAIFRAGATGPYDSAIRVADALIEQAAALRALADTPR